MSDDEIIDDLLDYAWSKTCTHRQTYRGGAIWEICRSCGKKWADDEGGKPEWETPQAIRKAEALLARIKEEPEPTHYAVLDEHGEILKSRKVSDDVDDRAILQWYADRHGNDDWTVKGVTVHA